MLNDADIAIRRLTSQPDSDFPWTNLTAGADLADQLSELTGGLRDPGTGKRIESGFSYWGVESTVAWGEAVADAASRCCSGPPRTPRCCPVRWPMRRTRRCCRR